MGISAKQFNALAGELQLELNQLAREKREPTFGHAVEAVIKFCEKENVRFDAERFRTAVYRSNES